MQVQHFVQVQIGVDGSFNEKIYYQESPGCQIAYAGMMNADSNTFILTPGQTLTVPIAQSGGVQVPRGLFIKSSALALVSINGGAAIPMTPGAVNTVCKMFMEASFTSLTITNPMGSINSITGVWVIWGDGPTTT